MPCARQLDRVLLDQHHERALGRAVGRVAAVAHAELGAHREQVDLPARRPARGDGGDLVARGGLAHEHGGLEVDLDDLVEGRFADLGVALLALDADAVDEQVEAAEAAGDAVDGRADAVGRNARPWRHRSRRGRPRAATPASASALAALRPATATRAPAQREPPGDRRADAAVAAGDERGAAGQAGLAGEQARVVGGAEDSVMASQSICRPPLRSRISPVMKPESGEARKRTACANSSGSQKRPTGIWRSSAWRCSSFSCSVTIGVRT